MESKVDLRGGNIWSVTQAGGRESFEIWRGSNMIFFLLGRVWCKLLLFPAGND